MNATGACTTWWRDGWHGWNRFWFTSADCTTLSVIRICTGVMLLYTHLVWSFDLAAFFGPHSWISEAAAHEFYAGGFADPEFRAADPYGGRSFAWSYFHWTRSSGPLWIAHIAALIVFVMLTLGVFSRVASVLAYLAALSYVHRAPAALFGLDQINCLLAMYLIVGPCGRCYSLDAWWRNRRGADPLPQQTVAANVAIRLIQLHMCIVYLFAGLGKLTGGGSWWAGFGVWGAIANLEYQTLDATWLAGWPLFSALLSQGTVFWELFYCAAIWPRWTRPVVLLIAVPIHLGIGLFMGMITFGVIMLVGNLAFVSPATVRNVVHRLQQAARRFQRAPQ